MATRTTAPSRGNKASFDTTLRHVSYLLRRAGFGAPPSDILSAARRGLSATVDALVDYDSLPGSVTPPAAPLGPKMGDPTEIAAWWLNLMLATHRPLQEKMVLFWHGHFATGIQKVRNTLYMYKQNQLFRDNALGRFDDLLRAVNQDPAMLVWLDGGRNTKQAPNENWGREVMELFTLGHGSFTEDDVHACSRAFTGWRIVNDQGVFVPRLHDDSVKALLGQTGNWGSDDAVRILAAHPATGPFLATKLWRFFASDNPPVAAIKKIAGVYYNSDHSVREMLRTIFNLPEFYAPQNQTGHVKSPTEFVVTPLRQLGLTTVDTMVLARTTTLLGQELFNPPNVGGWPAGPTWINAGTMLGRFNFASRLTGDVGTDSWLDPRAVLTDSGADDMDQLVGYLAGVLGISTSQSTARALFSYAGRGSLDRADVESKVRGLIHLMLVSPEYQAS